MKNVASFKLEFSSSKHPHLVFGSIFSAFYLAICLTGYFLIKPFHTSVIYTLFFAFVTVFPLVLMWRDIYRDRRAKPLPKLLRV